MVTTKKVCSTLIFSSTNIDYTTLKYTTMPDGIRKKDGTTQTGDGHGAQGHQRP